MKIDSIKIQNFRTLEDITIPFEGHFSAISGKNNAGKTSVIKSIRNILREDTRDYFYRNDEEIRYSSSKTQWLSDSNPIKFTYCLHIERSTDPGLLNFVSKISEIQFTEDRLDLQISSEHLSNNETEITIFANNKELNKYATKEIYQRIRSSNIVFLHNSTEGASRIPYGFGGAKMFHEMLLSKDEKDELQQEQERIKKKVKKIAQQHRSELAGLLGKLEEKYEVEFTTVDRMFSSSIPLGINLKDKNLEVPLDDWGSGTINRTQIMMSILQANKVRLATSDENRITPIVIIEEPECFLHPSAQAEFGKIIRDLARELEIQIIITTHSPYMLCQEYPKSNILLNRRMLRGRLKNTEVVEVDEKNWMNPFSEILGLDNESFEPWKPIIGAKKNHAVLVEGIIDKEYLEFISSLNIPGYTLPDNIEVLPYDGKDTLKNSIVLKFVTEKFSKIFITFDLDAKNEITRSLTSIGLTEFKDYLSIGEDEPGKDCIEGLLPESVLSATYSKHPNAVMKMSSTDTKIRKSAKNELKRYLLDEFKAVGTPSKKDLIKFKPVFTHITEAFKI